MKVWKLGIMAACAATAFSGAAESQYMFRHNPGGAVLSESEPSEPPGPASCDDSTLVVGDSCTASEGGGETYIGDVGGQRVFASASDLSGGYYGHFYYYEIGSKCSQQFGSGWRLPTYQELALLWTNREAIDLAAIGIKLNSKYYWSSDQHSSNTDWHAVIRMTDGDTSFGTSSSRNPVRCVLIR